MCTTEFALTTISCAFLSAFSLISCAFLSAFSAIILAGRSRSRGSSMQSSRQKSLHPLFSLGLWSFPKVSWKSVRQQQKDKQKLFPKYDISTKMEPWGPFGMPSASGHNKKKRLKLFCNILRVTAVLPYEPRDMTVAVAIDNDDLSKLRTFGAKPNAYSFISLSAPECR